MNRRIFLASLLATTTDPKRLLLRQKRDWPLRNELRISRDGLKSPFRVICHVCRKTADAVPYYQNGAPVGRLDDYWVAHFDEDRECWLRLPNYYGEIVSYPDYFDYDDVLLRRLEWEGGPELVRTGFQIPFKPLPPVCI